MFAAGYLCTPVFAYFSCLDRALLATHPKAQAAVAAELHMAGLLATPVKKIPRQINYADLSRLPYLDAVRTPTPFSPDSSASQRCCAALKNICCMISKREALMTGMADLERNHMECIDCRW